MMLSLVISIHAPREGSDDDLRPTGGPNHKFLSTLPARGATVHDAVLHRRPAEFLSTLPARGATRSASKGSTAASFLSTLPARGATKFCCENGLIKEISIHAPREGSDAQRSGSQSRCTADFYPRSPRGERQGRLLEPRNQSNFYPRSPRGERRFSFGRGIPLPKFLSTLPARGATRPGSSPGGRTNISIHAPREGSDDGAGGRARHRPHFYPRSPRGERLALVVETAVGGGISIHAPREGSDTALQRDTRRA